MTVAIIVVGALSLFYFFTLKDLIMTTKEELSAQIDELSATAQASNDKADQLIAAVGAASAQIVDLKKQIDDLQAGGGATQAELGELSAKVAAVKAGLDEQSAQDDAALTPPAQ